MGARLGGRDERPNVIEVHINRLRSKLNNAGSPKLIQTVRGSGYQFVEHELQPHTNF